MLRREGLRYIVWPVLIGIACLVLVHWAVALPLFTLSAFWAVALALFALSAFMAYFFRDPERVVPTETNIVLSPSDGRITRIKLLNPDDPLSGKVVSIFLSPLDVHINRSPIAGMITKRDYIKGKLRTAMREEASLVNEQNVLTIEGQRITVQCKQIAGVLARRIICWKDVGSQLALGERFGMILFSSRTDLVLPPEVELLVHEGMRVRGGETIIGRLP